MNVVLDFISLPQEIPLGSTSCREGIEYLRNKAYTNCTYRNDRPVERDELHLNDHAADEETDYGR